MSSFYLFSGFVQGDPGAEPRLMQFHPNFKDGALLTVVSFLLHILFFRSYIKVNNVVLITGLQIDHIEQ